MFTDVTFVNHSLNRNVRSVGLFWANEGGAVPLCWYQITRCGFLWTHPFRINWDPQVLLEYGDGNICGPFGPAGAPAGVTVEAGQDCLHLKLDNPGQFAKAAVCYGGHAISMTSVTGRNDFALGVPIQLYLCADLEAGLGKAVTPQGLNASSTAVDLAGSKTATIEMKGGDPGPRSTAIRFLITESATR